MSKDKKQKTKDGSNEKVLAKSSPGQTGMSVTRRGAITAGTVGVLGGLGLGAGGSRFSAVDNAQALVPLAAAGIGGIAIVYGAYAYRDQRDQLERELEDTNEQIHWSIVSQLITTREALMQQENEARSKFEALKGAMYADAKNEISKALNDGQNQDTAVQNAQEAVNEHVALIEESLLENANLQGYKLENIWNDAETADLLGEPTEFEDEIDEVTVQRDYYDPEFYRDNVQNSNSYLSYDSEQSVYDFTTVEGKEYEIKDWDIVLSSNGSRYISGGFITSTGGRDVQILDPAEERTSWQTEVEWSDNREAPHVEGTLNLIREQRDEVLTELDQIAEEIYANNQPGDLDTADQNISEAINNRISDDTDSGVASYAAAAQMGYQTDADANYTIEYQERDAEGELKEEQILEGVMLAENDTFTDNIQTGTTYDTDSLDGEIYYMYNVADRTEQILLDGRFTVLEIYDNDGNEVEEVEQQDNRLSTRDTSNMNQQLDEINNRRQRLDDRNELPSNDSGLGLGGGGLGLGSGIPSWVLGIPVVGAIIAAWLAAQD